MGSLYTRVIRHLIDVFTGVVVKISKFSNFGEVTDRQHLTYFEKKVRYIMS